MKFSKSIFRLTAEQNVYEFLFNYPNINHQINSESKSVQEIGENFYLKSKTILQNF